MRSLFDRTGEPCKMSQGSVLVLDNNPAHARHISKMLEVEKWSSVLTFDRRMAMTALRNTRFHLLMFEAFIGQDSTLQVIGEIRSRASDTPLAIMANSIGGERAIQKTHDMARAAGVEFVMAKPFSPERLRSVLSETTTYHRARQTTKSILVVEDNANLRKLITGVLSELGYQVHAAACMEEAFEATRMGMIDLVIADIFMPGMGGIEGISRIRMQWPHIRVVAMSAGMENKLDPHAVLAASKHVGAAAQLAKPFVIDDLIHVVALVLGGEGATQTEPAPAEAAKHVA